MRHILLDVDLLRNHLQTRLQLSVSTAILTFQGCSFSVEHRSVAQDGAGTTEAPSKLHCCISPQVVYSTGPTYAPGTLNQQWHLEVYASRVSEVP